MFEFCADPSVLGDVQWLACYLTTAKHANLYFAAGLVLVLLAITAPTALAFGFAAASAARSKFRPLAWLAHGYINLVRGVPDTAFFLFFIIALDQGFEWVRHKIKCPDWNEPIRQGNDFIVCQAAKMPLGEADQWVHEIYGFFLAVLTFALVFGAFAGNVIYGVLALVALYGAYLVVMSLRRVSQKRFRSGKAADDFMDEVSDFHSGFAGARDGLELRRGTATVTLALAEPAP